jgi:hypothetical protein
VVFGFYWQVLFRCFIDYCDFHLIILRLPFSFVAFLDWIYESVFRQLVLFPLTDNFWMFIMSSFCIVLRISVIYIDPHCCWIVYICCWVFELRLCFNLPVHGLSFIYLYSFCFFLFVFVNWAIFRWVVLLDFVSILKSCTDVQNISVIYVA